jgi:hypothetical protein
MSLHAPVVSPAPGTLLTVPITEQTNMKKLIATAALALATVPALAADVGVSVTIGQPGFYGHIDIGGYPQPRVIYRQPARVVPGRALAPVYMHVPPGHAKNWRRYCGRYEACGRPVYFVQDSWYNSVYVPRYQQRTHYREERHDHRHEHRDNRRADRKDHRDDHGKHGGRHDDQGRGHR